MLKQLKPIVTAHDLMGLKNLEGYVMLPEFNAVTKVKLPYVSKSNVDTITGAKLDIQEKKHG
jgi:hypothetical protein